MTRIITADEARALQGIESREDLSAKTRWPTWSDCVYDLAATVVAQAAQAAEIDALKAQVNEQAVALRVVALWLGGPHHDEDPESVSALARAKGKEIDGFRAITEGRTVPPTDEEIEAHEAAGGRWRCVVPMALHLCADAMHGRAARMHRDCLIAAGYDSLWWATDGRARPGPWPAVAPRVPR